MLQGKGYSFIEWPPLMPQWKNILKIMLLGLLHFFALLDLLAMRMRWYKAKVLKDKTKNVHPDYLHDETKFAWVWTNLCPIWISWGVETYPMIKQRYYLLLTRGKVWKQRQLISRWKHYLLWTRAYGSLVKNRIRTAFRYNPSSVFR